MPTEIETISRKIARSPLFDGYSLWRILKQVNNRIFDLQRKRCPVPIELGKLRAIIVRAQELRRKSGWSPPAAARPAEVRIDLPVADGFDPFGLVDRHRCRAGGRGALNSEVGSRRDRALEQKYE